MYKRQDQCYANDCADRLSGQGQHVVLVMALSIGLVILQIFTALGSGLALSAIVPLAKARAGGRAADPSFSVTTLTRSFVAIHLLAASVAALFTLGGGGGGG